MGSRREQALAVGLVLLIVLLASLAAPDAERSSFDPRASSFRSAPLGAKALYLALDELGIPVERRLTPWVDGDSLRGPLALLAPTQPLTPTEITALVSRVEAGGALLYAARPDDPLLDTLGLVLDMAATRGERPRPIRVAAEPAPHPWTEGMGEVEGFGWVFADTARAVVDGAAVPLLRAPDGKVVALTIRRGGGSVVAWSDARPLSNAALRESGAAVLFARAAAAAVATEEGRPLVFDEYHHGYREGVGAARATFAFLRDTGPGRMALQLALVGLGLLVLLGRRFGAPLAPPAAHRRSPLEHVEALAGAYRQGGARATARRLLLAGLARRLGRPAPAQGREAEFLEQLAHGLPAACEPAAALLAEWGRGPRADLVSLTHHADRLVAEARRL